MKLISALCPQPLDCRRRDRAGERILAARRLRRRLLLGNAARLRIAQGRDRRVAGYAGGNADTAQYETVSTGTTGHAESVEITYDPAQISFKQLLDVYFSSRTIPPS